MWRINSRYPNDAIQLGGLHRADSGCEAAVSQVPAIPVDPHPALVEVPALPTLERSAALVR